MDAPTDPPPGPRRATVGVYDRPAGADRRPMVIKAAVFAVAAAVAALGWYLVA
jgi:hypothetical protein